MKKTFTFIALILLAFASTISAQLPELLYYKFDAPGTSVQNHALTPVGSNPATITGTGLSIGNVGLHGTALVGTGVSATSGVINTGWSTNLSGSFTIAFWTSNIAPSSTLWYIWGDAGASSLRCFTNGVAGANNWILRGGGLPDLLITGGATAAPNMIHAVYDATTQQYRGYLNGVLVNTVSTSFTSMSGSGFQVGGYSSNSNLNGLMDEFRIGCTNLSDPINIVIHPLPAVFLGNDTALLPVQSILLNAGPGFNSYLWSTGAVTQSILVDSSGIGIGVKTVWVHVTDNYYCVGGDTILINFTNHPGINEALANAEIRVFPNPSDGRIEIHFGHMPTGIYTLEIFSPDGKAVYRSKHQLNNNKINLDLNHLSGGLYLLKVTGDQGTVSRRLIIEN